MNRDITKKYLLSKPDAVEEFPFTADVAVFKINNKMFATLATEQGVARCNLKCDPDEALILRDIFSGVTPGYHMNKRHWNTVFLDGSIPKGEIERMIDCSYSLVIKAMKKYDRKALEMRHGIDALYR